jgi:hypothetical protein
MFELPLRKELFWDIDVNHLDAGKNKRLIIDRVLSIGNLSELKIIIQYYGKETIISEIKQIGYLDPKTLEFVVSYFGIGKEELKCYIKKLSARQYWN